MAICNGCGGVVGRDCFNPQECEWIARDQERHRHEQHEMSSQHLEQRVEELERKLQAVENLLSAMMANGPHEGRPD
jgi:uncharacterized protein YceH (UPF0502 family)